MGRGLDGRRCLQRRTRPRWSSRRSSDILARGRREPAFVDGQDEDVHAFVERQLVERVGDLGKRLHTGRSRNEQVSLDLRLYLRRRIPRSSSSSQRSSRRWPSKAGAARQARDAVVHASAPGAAGPGRAFLPGACRRRFAAIMPACSWAIAGSRRHAARLRRRRRHQLRHRHRDAGVASSGFRASWRNSIDASSDRDFVVGVSLRRAR